MNNKLLNILALVLIPLISFSHYLFALGSAGFENASFSAKTLGQGNAVVARPQDPSTIMFNPAGLMELPGIQVAGGFQALDWRTFHTRTNGDESHSKFKIIPLPSFYLTMNPGKLLDNRVAIGVGVNSPFGLSSTWDSISVARTGGYKNAMKVLATTMSGAVRITDWLKFGGGATNYWMYDYGQSFNFPNAFVLGNTTSPDGMVRTETNGYGWGWNMGILLKPHPKHKVGVSYRSRATVQVHGRAVIEGIVSGAAQGFDVFPNWESGVHSNISIPANLTIGYAYEPSEKWGAEFDFGPTFWGVFKDMDFGFDRPNATVRALGRIPRDYKTTWSFNWGGHYQAKKNLDLLGGFFFYLAASPKNHIDNFIPDANRYGWTLGTSYKINDRMDIDFMYLFMLFGTRKFSNPQQLARAGENIDGKFTSIIHGAFVTFTYRFDFPFEKRVFGKVEKSPAITS